MKEKRDLKSINTILPLLGLALLLFLSPCKIRNFIQGELGVPQTEVSNRSQSTIENASCSNVQIATNTLIKQKYSSQHLPAVLAQFESTFKALDFANNDLQLPGARNHSASAIPLYILYQNFKDYI